MTTRHDTLLPTLQRLFWVGLLLGAGCDQDELGDSPDESAEGKADDAAPAIRELDLELDSEALVLDEPIDSEDAFTRALGVAVPDDLDFETHTVAVYQAEIPVNGGWQAGIVKDDGEGSLTLGCQPAERLTAEVVVVAVPRGLNVVWRDDDFEANGCEATAESLEEIGKMVDVSYVRPNLLEAQPDRYRSPSVTGVSMGGKEFWQKWPGGHSPTFSFSEGSPFGQRCMQASAERFTAIMSELPEEVAKLREETNWSGSFFNWNDDYSGEGSSGRARGPRLWAWRTGLIKWISQTTSDGACFLPTRELVLEMAATCLAKGESNDKEIKGCRAS